MYVFIIQKLLNTENVSVSTSKRGREEDLFENLSNVMAGSNLTVTSSKEDIDRRNASQKRSAPGTYGRSDAHRPQLKKNYGGRKSTRVNQSTIETPNETPNDTTIPDTREKKAKIF